MASAVWKQKILTGRQGFTGLTQTRFPIADKDGVKLGNHLILFFRNPPIDRGDDGGICRVNQRRILKARQEFLQFQNAFLFCSLLEYTASHVLHERRIGE